MVDVRREIDHYNTIYRNHSPGKSGCIVSLDDLPKVRTRVRQVLKTFRLTSRIRGARVLEIGCGLGYFAEAIRLEGASVVAVDVSSEGIRLAGSMFPDIEYRCLLFPQEFDFTEKFDIIWVVDIFTLNTFDASEMDRNLIAPAMKALNPSGVLIVGWHSNFSGRVHRVWSHWTLRTIWDLRKKLAFSGSCLGNLVQSILRRTPLRSALAHP